MARAFTGAQSITITDNSYIQLNGMSFTVALWAYRSGAWNAGFYPRMISKLTGGAPYTGWEFLVSGDTGKPYAQVGSPLVSVSSSTAMSTDTWTHLAITYNNTSGAVAFYRNGSADGTGSFGASAVGSTGSLDCLIGNWAGSPASNHHWIGNLAEIGVWTAVLDAGKIAELGKGVSPRLYPKNQILCSPMVNALRDERGGVNGVPMSLSNGGSTVAAHPRIHRGRGWSDGMPAAAAAASTPTDFRVGAQHTADSFSQWKLSP